MPIYEFECEQCGADFDDLVSAGTEHAPCPRCGSERTARRFSAPASTFKLVKSPGAARQQEQRNAKLHADTRARFKERRQRAREAKRKGGAGA
jgi:putative FmdB family regulatory protein